MDLLPFDYFTLPRPKGATWTVTRDLEWTSERPEGIPNWKTVYPFTNQIEIVGRE